MAARYRKYFNQCKSIQCTGRRSRQCPETPRRVTGAYKACGTWCIEFFDDSNQWQSLTFKDIRNKSDAEKRLTLFISDRERGQLKLPKKKAVPTLAEYAKEYLALHKGAKENTLAIKRRALGVLVRYLGEHPLDKITPFIIEKYRIQRKEQDEVKDNSINLDVQVLSHVFTTAISEGIIDINPCQKVKRLKISQVKDRVLSGDEISTILDMPEGKDRLMILTALFTGMRLNEVLSLTWDDIDFGKGIIHVFQSKTSKTFDIPLSDCLRTALEAYRTHPASSRVFEDRGITKKVVVEYSKHFSRLFKGMGIPGFTFHNLRHTFASIMQSDLGIGAVTVMGMTGHSSLGMLQKYSHTGLDSKQRAIQALNSHVVITGRNISQAVGQ
ncbi:MAG TPA: tyrosine-type recombinase/integrase [Candidatus Brocadiaceae bacterium]|nr:tyrosine-type recombinase/integrase [Candidatus Brocadiaceae bacterium]